MAFEPERLLAVLAAHRVEFVVVGGLAANVLGSTLVTTDADVVPASDLENLDRLSSALSALDAKVRATGVPYGLPFRHSGRSLALAEIWNLTTEFGDLDIIFRPSGTSGYDGLILNAATHAFGAVTIQVAALDDLIRSKEAAGRPKDTGALPLLRRLRELRSERADESPRTPP